METLREQARRQEAPQIEEPLPAELQAVVQRYLGRQMSLPALAQWLGGSKEEVVKGTPLQLAELFDVREQLIAVIAGGPSFFNLTSSGKAFYVVKALLT